MKLFGYWTVFVALGISAVAAYYSIVGLVAIFAAAMLPIIIMGAALEVGKITTAVWLHTYWDKAAWHIKTYLSIALVLLMFITSMGIFGFLSKAHIEQTAQATEGVAQIERIETEISRFEEVVARAEVQIQKLENANVDADEGIQQKIDAEQQRIDTAYERIQPAINEQKQLLLDNLAPYESQLTSIDSQLELYNTYNAENNIRDLQRLVGTTPDGRYGPGTKKAVDDWLTTQNNQREETLAKLQELRDNSSNEIQRIRKIAENEIADSNKLISRLRDQLGRNDNSEQVALDISEQRDRIKEANVEIELLFDQKFEIEKQARLLEAEVGPVKYIAEMVYGNEATTNMLEEAVRWVILILVVVFDPLAVVLIIAGITLIENAPSREKKQPDKKEIPMPEKPIEEMEHNEIMEEFSRMNQEIENSYGDIGDYNPMVREHNRKSESVEVKLPEFNFEEQTTSIPLVDKEKPKEPIVEHHPAPSLVDYEAELARRANESKSKEELIKDMLSHTDPTKLEEVYNKITKDLNQKKEI